MRFALTALSLLACAAPCPDTGSGVALEVTAASGAGTPVPISAITWSVDGGEEREDYVCSANPCIRAEIGDEPGTYRYDVTACAQTLSGEVEVRGNHCGVAPEDRARVELRFNGCGAR